MVSQVKCTRHTNTFRFEGPTGRLWVLDDMGFANL
jgi:hypothetical protein